MTVAAFVQSHPARAHLAEPLAARIGGRPVYDPDPDGHPSAWRCYRRCLQEAPAGAAGVLVVQDDADAVDGLLWACAAIVAAHPGRPVVMWHSTAPRENLPGLQAACAQDVPLVELPSRRWCPVVGLLWPVELVAPALEWIDAQTWPAQFVADDEIVGQAFRALGVVPLATVPSLVEHPDVEPSITGMRAWAGEDPSRVAWCYDPGLDVRAVDWTAPPLAV